MDGQKKWGITTQFNAVRDVHRVFNWAVQQQLLAKSPIQGMPRPQAQVAAKLMLPTRNTGLCAGGRQRRSSWCSSPFGKRELAPAKFEIFAGIKFAMTVGFSRSTRPRQKPINRGSFICRVVMQRIMQILRRNSKSPHVFVNCHGEPWTNERNPPSDATPVQKTGAAE